MRAKVERRQELSPVITGSLSWSQTPGAHAPGLYACACFAGWSDFWGKVLPPITARRYWPHPSERNLKSTLFLTNAFSAATIGVKF